MRRSGHVGFEGCDWLEVKMIVCEFPDMGRVRSFLPVTTACMLFSSPALSF